MFACSLVRLFAFCACCNLTWIYLKIKINSKARRRAVTTPRGEPSAPRGGRRRPREHLETNRPTKLPRPTPLLSPDPVSPPTRALGHLPARVPLTGSLDPSSPPAHTHTHTYPRPSSSLPPIPTEVLFVGPEAPPVLQAVSPSGDVRLSLRRYSVGDSLDAPHILLRLDLRIHPRDLYTIPSDGHCGFHTLAVLTHPH